MYCFACGTRMAQMPPCRCQQCGTEHWRNAKPCAGALVTRAGKLLLTRRAIEPWSGRWDIPGGFCEADEHPIATAEREVLEETGHVVRVTDLIGIWLDDYGSASPVTGQIEITLNIYYHAILRESDAGEPDPGEVSELRWFAPDELPEEIAFPRHMPEVVEVWRKSAAAADTAGGSSAVR